MRTTGRPGTPTRRDRGRERSSADAGERVTIHDHAGRALGQGWLELGGGRLSEATTDGAAGVLRAPLWMLSLGTDVVIEDDRRGRHRARVREVTGMDGPIATVNVDVRSDPPSGTAST